MQKRPLKELIQKINKKEKTQKTLYSFAIPKKMYVTFYYEKNKCRYDTENFYRIKTTCKKNIPPISATLKRSIQSIITRN